MVLINKCVLILICTVMVISFAEKEAQARKYFMLERPMLGLDLSYEFEQEERTGPHIERKDTTQTLSERLDIETGGWFYLPALAVYTLKLSPEWQQSFDQPEGGERRTTDFFLMGYSAEVIFLQYKPYTLRLFADRYRTTLLSSFAQRSRTEAGTYGATLMLKYRELPTTVDYKHEESSQKGFFVSDRKSDGVRLNMKYDRSLGETLFNASFTDSHQTTQSTPIHLLTKNAVIQNYAGLTKDKRVTLASGLGFRASEGDAGNSKGHSWSENLQWRHLENLSTNYTLRYDTNTSEDFTTETKGINFNLRHLLYETLQTSITADASTDEFTGGETGQYMAGVDFNYRREVPKGMLNINMGYNYGLTNQDFVPGFVQVLDEPAVLTDGGITLLANKHVDINSVFVTDSTGTISYIRDIDYRLIEMDPFVRISRITGGEISEGQALLVDYSYNSSPPFDYSTFSQYYGVSLNLWSSWRIYYDFSRSRQRALSGTPPGSLMDDNIHTVGTELDWKWSRTALEAEDRDTTILPLTRWRMEETVTLRPSQKTFLNFSGHYEKYKFKDTGEIERFSGIRADVQYLVTSWGRFRFEGSKNKISGSREDYVDSGFLTAFEWVYRIWNGKLSYRFLNEEDRVTQQTRANHYVLFEIKRRLF